MYQDKSIERKKQENEQISEGLAKSCGQFLKALMIDLDKKLDRRLLKTLRDLVLIIIIHRHRNNGLLLSELGGYLMGAHRAPAGTKRIAALLHSKKWGQEAIEEFLWKRGNEKVYEVMGPDSDPYVIWDESVLEKPESLKAEGLCAVISSKAKRLKRIRPGFFNPPGGRPICGPGFHWLQILVLGMKGAPTLAHWRCWTTRGERETNKRAEEAQILQKVAQLWGMDVVHIWDRGFAGSPWVSLALHYHLRFIVRWQKNYKLVGPDGQAKKAWQITRGKRSLDHRLIYDCKRHCERKTGIFVVPVHLPGSSFPLWLVVSRPGPGKQPWYLLTSDPIDSLEDAWRTVFAYNRRWQVEMSLRFDKSELAFESPRLQKWEVRMKFIAIALLAHAFMIQLLSPRALLTRNWLLSFWCHRTGKRSRFTSAPLYRLRFALSLLWLYFRPPCLPLLISG